MLSVATFLQPCLERRRSAATLVSASLAQKIFIIFSCLAFIGLCQAASLPTATPTMFQPPRVVTRPHLARSRDANGVTNNENTESFAQLTARLADDVAAVAINAINSIIKQPRAVPSVPVSLPKPTIKPATRSATKVQAPKSVSVMAGINPAFSPHPLQVLGSDNAVELSMDAVTAAAAATTNAAASILSRIIPTRLLKAILPDKALTSEATASDVLSVAPNGVNATLDNSWGVGEGEKSQQDPTSNMFTSIATSQAAAALQKAERTAEELHAGITCGVAALATAAASELERRGLSQLLKSAVHEHGLVRFEAALALGRLADARATAVLLRLAMTDNYIHARRAAVDSLRSVARANEGVGKQIKTALNNVLQATPNPNVGWKAANALAAMGDVSVTDYILKVLDKSEDEWIAWEGLNTLEKLPPSEAMVSIVYPFLTHPSSRVADVALACISNMSTISVLAWRALRACRKHPVPEIAAKALAAAQQCPAKTLAEAMLMVSAHQSRLAEAAKPKPPTSHFRTEL